MNVLITGGAGYIGSTVANLFLDKKHKVSIIDNLSTGKKSNIPKKSIFYKCDISDKKKVKKILKRILILFCILQRLLTITIQSKTQ